MRFTPDGKYQKICYNYNPTIISKFLSSFIKTKDKKERAEKLKKMLNHIPKNKNMVKTQKLLSNAKKV